jgi:hypothetical protein
LTFRTPETVIGIVRATFSDTPPERGFAFGEPSLPILGGRAPDLIDRGPTARGSEPGRKAEGKIESDETRGWIRSSPREQSPNGSAASRHVERGERPALCARHPDASGTALHGP